MRSEEPLEDRKLLTVKSWFTRSLSSVSSQNGSVYVTSDGNSSSISVSKEGVVESGPGFTPLRQLSMRRSRPSGEFEKESGAGSPSMTPRNITPLTPLTPLRWKSNPREQEEEEKAMERSRLGSAVSNGMPHEEHSDGKLVASNGKEERSAEGHQQGTSVPESAGFDRTQSIDELSTKAQAGIVGDIATFGSPEGLDRKPSSGDDVMTMTIEFLRARLLSERSASKAAKVRVQQLATKVSELEQKLDQAIEDRKKSELAAHEALTKLKLAESSNQVTDRTSSEVSDRSNSNSTKGSPLPRSRAGREDTKYPQQEISNEDLSRTNSYGSSVEDRDSSTKKQLPEIVSKIEGRRAEVGLPVVRSSLQNISERNQESPQKQDSRAAIESRLRNMWNKISEEMAALAEERSEEDVVREELMSWMGQVPTVLQDIIPEKLVSLSRDAHLKSEPERTDSQMAESHSGPSPKTLQENGQLPPNSKRALLHGQFAAQETVQQEWERNYHESQRKLDQFKGIDRNADRSPNGHRQHQHADHLHGADGVADDASFLGSHHARISKSASALDLPAKPNGYNLDMNPPYRDGPHVESDSWNRERSRRPGSDSRHHELVNQNTPAHGHMPLEHTQLNHGRVRQDRSAAPSILQEAGPGAMSDRQLDQEAGVYYQDTGNRSGYPAFVEGGVPDRPQWPSNRSAEDGFRSSQSDFRAGQSTWDDRDRRNSGRHQQAQLGYGDDNGRLERDSYSRDSEREESYNSSQPESTPRHRHRRSHSDTSDWPPVEDDGLLNQQPEPSPGLGRRQQFYSDFPAAVAADLSRTNFDKASGSYGDLRYSDERMYGTRGQRRESYPASKADYASGPPYSTHAGRNSSSDAEPALVLGYGPAYDAPREGSPVRQSSNAGTNKNINDVLRALQMAKANIQHGGAGSKERRLSADQASLKAGYGMEPSAHHTQAARQPTPERYRYFESQSPLSKPSRPASQNAKYDRYEADFDRERYQSEGDAMTGTNATSNYADQLNVGKGIQFFFP